MLIVERCRASCPKAHIASAMGISRKCVSTWVARYAAEVETRIVELRVRERRGPDWLAAELWGADPHSLARPAAPPGTTRGGSGRMTGQVIRTSKTTAVRYERERPGELVHMDVKKLGVWSLAAGPAAVWGRWSLCIVMPRCNTVWWA